MDQDKYKKKYLKYKKKYMEYQRGGGGSKEDEEALLAAAVIAMPAVVSAIVDIANSVRNKDKIDKKNVINIIKNAIKHNVISLSALSLAFIAADALKLKGALNAIVLSGAIAGLESAVINTATGLLNKENMDAKFARKIIKQILKDIGITGSTVGLLAAVLK